jgi:hypothetical protein
MGEEIMPRSIPEDINEVIDNGLRCPICDTGFIKKIPVGYYFELRCSHCNKGFVIRYKDNPFEIVRIDEVKK